MKTLNAIILVFLLTFGTQTAFAQQVGSVTGYNTNATGKLASGSVQIVDIGKSVFYNQSISTDATGRVQARLLDGSSFTLTANTTITIDEFFYDPAPSTGKMVASVVEGALQFVGGKLSKKPDQVEIITTAGTIGIRGGIAMIRITPDENDAEFSFHFGDQMKIDLNDGRSFTLTKPGTSLRMKLGSGGRIASARIGKVSARHSRSIRSLRGNARKGGQSNQRKAEIQKGLARSGLSAISGKSVSKQRIGARIKLGSRNRRKTIKRARKTLTRHRRNF